MSRARATAEVSDDDRPAESDTPRGRGRPRRDLGREQIADAVEEILADGGYEAVSIEETARRLGVSRATLYRTVPSKEHLMSILFERMTGELYTAALAIVEDSALPARERLQRLVREQIDAACRHGHHLLMFFGDGLPAEDLERWASWQRDYEGLWIHAVTAAIEAGDLPDDDPRVVTCLLTGMTTWVARWVRRDEPLGSTTIADIALRLVLPEAPTLRREPRCATQ